MYSYRKKTKHYILPKDSRDFSGLQLFDLFSMRDEQQHFHPMYVFSLKDVFQMYHDNLLCTVIHTCSQAERFISCEREGICIHLLVKYFTATSAI